MAAKLIAAVDARKDPDLVIAARIDAIAVEGINAAIDRGNIYREAGADLIFVEAPESVEQLRNITSEIDATPPMANMIFGTKTPILTPAEDEVVYILSDYDTGGDGKLSGANGFFLAYFPVTLVDLACGCPRFPLVLNGQLAGQKGQALPGGKGTMVAKWLPEAK